MPNLSRFPLATGYLYEMPHAEHISEWVAMYLSLGDTASARRIATRYTPRHAAPVAIKAVPGWYATLMSSL